MTEVHGVCDPRFQRVRDTLEQNLGSGKEVGASVYVNVGGEDVVDLWGGWRDQEHTAAWTEDTIVTVFSGTKTVTSLAVLMLADRGELDVYAPVAEYWPEFAANGKENVQVRHLLSHTSGVSGWELPFSFDDAFDIETASARLAAQAPWWEPGTASVYHASSFGHLNAELVRRVSGKTLPEFIRSEMAGPLSADFRLGVPDAEFGRIATVYPVDERSRSASPAGGPPPATDPAAAKTRAGSFTGTMGDPFETFNGPRWWRSVFGGSSGHCNASGLGRIISAVTQDGVTHGVKLLSPKTIDLIFDEQANGVDKYYEKPIRWGIGYALASAESNRRGPLPFLRPGNRTCFWYGTGGSLGIMDVERGITIAYVMNQCRSGRESLNGQYYEAVYDSVDRIDG
jgi:CubicO group peptidase (beta-lactamase class C family)